VRLGLRLKTLLLGQHSLSAFRQALLP
jgi:hypothetical protein